MINVDFISTSYKAGFEGEHNANTLMITPTKDMQGEESAVVYRLAFANKCGEPHRTEPIYAQNGKIEYAIPKSLTQHSTLYMTLEQYTGDELLRKSPMITLFFSRAVDDGEEIVIEDPDITTEIHANTAARHYHTNKDVLDKLSYDGELKYNGESLVNSEEQREVFFGVCNDGPNVGTKAISVDSSFVLREGVIVNVRFNSPSGGSAGDSRYLNVNGSGAHMISASVNNSYTFIPVPSGVIVSFVYANGYWCQMGFYIGSAINYGYVKLSDSINSQSDYSFGIAATPYAVKKVNDKINLKADVSDLDNYYSKTEIDEFGFQTEDDVDGKITSATQSLEDGISNIESLIPDQASSSNQLADKQFVNSSIATNTAYFRGTFESLQALNEYSGALTTNDYAFVVVYDDTEPSIVKQYNRYKYDGSSWVFEFTLNNSSFTAAQWEAIQSGITAALVAQISTNASNIALKANAADVYTEDEVDDIADTKINKNQGTSNAGKYLGIGNDGTVYPAELANIPTKVSDLEDASLYQTKAETDAALADKEPLSFHVEVESFDLEEGTVTFNKTFDEIYYASNTENRYVYLDIPQINHTIFDVTSITSTFIAWMDVIIFNNQPTLVLIQIFSDDDGTVSMTPIAEVSDIPDIPDIPTKVSDLTNDLGFQTGTQVANLILDAIPTIRKMVVQEDAGGYYVEVTTE